jgi:uncharacterized protein YjbJ (UPF0337 family)
MDKSSTRLHAEATLKKAEGDLQEAWGDMTHSPLHEGKGKMKRAEAAMLEKEAKTLDMARHPIG